MKRKVDLSKKWNFLIIFISVIIVTLIISVVISISINRLIIGFPLPIFTRTLLSATCINSNTGELAVCPQNMMIRNNWYPLNLIIDLILWFLASVIIVWFIDKLKDRK